MSIDKDILRIWILDEALQPPAKILKPENMTGISAYREEKQLNDNLYYDIHFIRRDMGKKKTHIASTLEALEDAINFSNIGIVENKTPKPLPHYNEQKLNRLCDLILEKIEEEGTYKLKLIGNDDFEIVPL